MKSLNINSIVRIKLLPHGTEVYSKYLKEYYKGYKCHQEEDENGYLFFHLWEVMQIFGSSMFNGAKPMIQGCAVLIEEKDLEELNQ